jgi:hypothetical protein
MKLMHGMIQSDGNNVNEKESKCSLLIRSVICIHHTEQLSLSVSRLLLLYYSFQQKESSSDVIGWI